MNASWDIARKPLLVFCFFLLLFPNRALGQAAPRVVEPVNNAQRVTLRRNVHPLAQLQYARGAVSPSQPMQHILLLLERSEAPLRNRHICPEWRALRQRHPTSEWAGNDSNPKYRATPNRYLHCFLQRRLAERPCANTNGSC